MRIIRATPQALYDAFVDPQAVAQWRPPAGMRAEIYNFEVRVGGGYRMAFVYASDDPEVRGKTTEKADVFTGTFVELVPDARIVEQATFESDDPAFAGVMTVTTTFRPVGDDGVLGCARGHQRRRPRGRDRFEPRQPGRLRRARLSPASFA